MRSSLARHQPQEPATPRELDQMRRTAWLRYGIVIIRPDEVEPTDPWFAQAARNYASKQIGPRQEGDR